MSSDLKSTVKSADRVLTLFELLGRWRREMSHAEIAEALDIPKSSLSQLLKNLVARGWLAYSPTTKGYFLGDSIIQIARGATQVRDLVGLSQPVLSELTATINETSALNILKGDKSEVVATVVGPHRLVTVMRLGEIAPLYATSGGKVILAFLPEEMREKYLSEIEVVPVTPKSVRSVEELRTQLESARREGIAYSFEEFTPGVVGMARPVLLQSGEVVASINVATPAARYDRTVRGLIASALEKSVTKLGQQISMLPGHALPRTATAP